LSKKLDKTVLCASFGRSRNLYKKIFHDNQSLNLEIGGFRLDKSALIETEKEAASTTDEYLSAKRLRRRKQKLAVVKRRKARNR